MGRRRAQHTALGDQAAARCTLLVMGVLHGRSCARLVRSKASASCMPTARMHAALLHRRRRRRRHRSAPTAASIITNTASPWPQYCLLSSCPPSPRSLGLASLMALAACLALRRLSRRSPSAAPASSLLVRQAVQVGLLPISSALAVLRLRRVCFTPERPSIPCSPLAIACIRVPPCCGPLLFT